MPDLATRAEQAEPEGWLGYCDDCNGPIMGRSRAYLAVSHVAYWLFMHLPGWLAFSKFGLAILPRAGDIAFACTCRDKIDAAIARAGEG